MENEKTQKRKLSRRDFLITLSSGTSIAIAGFFTFDAIRADTNKLLKNSSDKPTLSSLVKKMIEKNQVIVCNEHGKCLVNKTGESVIDLLDGTNTLSQISDKIADLYLIKHTDELEASIASFICQLGSQGFLASPFYVTMYETT